MNEVQLIYQTYATKIHTYNIDDSVYAEYLDYCKDYKLDFNKQASFIEFLRDSDLNYDIDYEEVDEILEGTTGINKIIEKVNDYTRN